MLLNSEGRAMRCAGKQGSRKGANAQEAGPAH
jgi:hypothetical protein